MCPAQLSQQTTTTSLYSIYKIPSLIDAHYVFFFFDSRTECL